MISQTPAPPYYAVIFTSTLQNQHEGYGETADRMVQLAEKEDGFLGIETARDSIGISVSYWNSLESIQKWKEQVEHAEAREKGRKDWYSAFKVRIAKVERDYGWDLEEA